MVATGYILLSVRGATRTSLASPIVVTPRLRTYIHHHLMTDTDVFTYLTIVPSASITVRTAERTYLLHLR